MLPKSTPTQMQLFLSEVEGTSYGGVLREINAFLHHRKDADDDFLRRQKDKSQKYVADSYQLSEAITSEFIGHLMEGLKARISSLASQVTFETNSADNIKTEYTAGFTPINKTIQDDKKGFVLMHNNIVNDDFFTVLNEWLLIEFSKYQATTKCQRDKLHHRLGRLESENFKRYTETLTSDEEGLLRLFYKLRDSEETVARIAELVTMRKQEQLEDSGVNGFSESTSGEDEMHWEPGADDNSSVGPDSSSKRKVSIS